jgi:hypothetical protein
MASPPPSVPSGLQIGQTANVQPVDGIVSQVVGSLKCEVIATGTQSAVCSLTANDCPSLTLSCGNDLKQILQCSDDNFDVRTVLQNEDLSGLAFAIGVSPGNKHKLDIDATWQKIETEQAAVCNAADLATQTIYQSIVCDASKDVAITELNQMSQQTACNVGNALKLARTARQYAADQYNAAQRARVQQWAMYGGIALAVVMVLLILGVGFL